MTHSDDCALILYAGQQTIAPLVCDCDAEEQDADDGEPAAAAPPVSSLRPGEERALAAYRGAVQAVKRATAQRDAALARLNDELSK